MTEFCAVSHADAGLWECVPSEICGRLGRSQYLSARIAREAFGLGLSG